LGYWLFTLLKTENLQWLMLLLATAFWLPFYFYLLKKPQPMTPQEIIEIFESQLTEDSKQQAIEDIHQYAKDFAKLMCDKQKLECTKVGYAMDAPYPNELI
jgi:hypothetical protein